MPHHITSQRSVLIAAMAAFFVCTGCSGDETIGGSEETGGSEGGDGDGDPDEAACACVAAEDSMSWPCQCEYANGIEPAFWGRPIDVGFPPKDSIGYVCGDDLTEGYTACAYECQATVEAFNFRIFKEAPVACTDYGSSMSCAAWNPSGEVTFNTLAARYQMSWGFAVGLALDPEPLWACDDASLEPLPSGGGFEVANANSGELLYELGLRNRDELLSINGLPLANYFDAGLAYGELFGQTSFTLKIRRGANIIEFDYVVFAT